MYNHFRNLVRDSASSRIARMLQFIRCNFFTTPRCNSQAYSVYKGRYGPLQSASSITMAQFLKQNVEQVENLVPAGPAEDSRSKTCVQDLLNDARDIPFLWGSKGGVPRRKGSLERQKGRHSGMHFKWLNLRLTPWYVCPLCGEPKQAEQVCRKEVCRRVRP